MEEQQNKYQEQTLFSITWPLFIELALHLGMGIVATLMLSQTLVQENYSGPGSYPTPYSD
ncbi:hypothetical protein [Neobacillus sp. DY30]|uniref:hypothetical protein n=1 Tax=Neobacillus sp. DY30 TaxID=3047871 RepID=UPI0032E3DF3F